MESHVASVQAWMTYHQLKMNDDKTEFLIISSKHQSKQLQVSQLKRGNQSISPSAAAKSLGVIVDAHLSMNSHISICRFAYYHLRSIGQMRRYLDVIAWSVLSMLLSPPNWTTVTYFFAVSHLLSCQTAIRPAAARILTGATRHSSMTPILGDLHWRTY